VIINSFCLKFVCLKFHRKKFSSGVDEANSIRDYFFCQQVVFRNRFSGSYLGKNISSILKADFCYHFYKNSPNLYWQFLNKNTELMAVVFLADRDRKYLSKTNR